MLQDLPVWLAHFRAQAAHPRQVPTTLDDTLTRREQRLICASISRFQLAESCDGTHLRRAVRRYCEAQEDHACVEIIDLLIAEEQRHANLLADFMQDHEIPLRDRALTLQAFRALRRLGGFAARLQILVCAEIIGIVYYRALEVVTDCRRLQILCRTVAADGLAHVAFQSQLLLAIKQRQPAVVRCLASAWAQCVLGTAAIGVWATHRRVLKAAGYGPRLFVRDCRNQYAFYLKWPPAPQAYRRPRTHHPLSPHGT